LGLTLPGERIDDPHGWVAGFWRYTFVIFIVIVQIACFGVGWWKSEGIFPKALASVYILLMGFWLSRSYFFGVEPDWWHCGECFSLTFFPALLYNGISGARQQARRDHMRRNE
jgi:hypothetical protein